FSPHMLTVFLSPLFLPGTFLGDISHLFTARSALILKTIPVAAVFPKESERKVLAASGAPLFVGRIVRHFLFSFLLSCDNSDK
ncbi:MAG: hypothetical protein V4671_23835, partial [Armatimonadota bacterium]